MAGKLQNFPCQRTESPLKALLVGRKKPTLLLWLPCSENQSLGAIYPQAHCAFNHASLVNLGAALHSTCHQHWLNSGQCQLAAGAGGIESWRGQEEGNSGKQT